MAVIIVPKTLEAWLQEPDFRVEHFNKSVASRCLVYFSDLSSAQAFAAEHTLFNQPCVVQSKAMTATHRVDKVSVNDASYLLWSKSFGDLETARAEFEVHREIAVAKGGAYQLVEIGKEKPLIQFANRGD